MATTGRSSNEVRIHRCLRIILIQIFVARVPLVEADGSVAVAPCCLFLCLTSSRLSKWSSLRWRRSRPCRAASVDVHCAVAAE